MEFLMKNAKISHERTTPMTHTLSVYFIPCKEVGCCIFFFGKKYLNFIQFIFQ